MEKKSHGKRAISISFGYRKINFLDVIYMCELNILFGVKKKTHLLTWPENTIFSDVLQKKVLCTVQQ